jgi:catechol 2,3-dioxygenase-like lactoylglutathione lyase family enzyme
MFTSRRETTSHKIVYRDCHHRFLNVLERAGRIFRVERRRQPDPRDRRDPSRFRVPVSARYARDARAPKQDTKIMGIKHVAFVVADLRSGLAALLKQGVQLIAVQRDRSEPMQPDPDPLAPGKWRPFSLFIADPFGTPIEILDGAQVGDGV